MAFVDWSFPNMFLPPTVNVVSALSSAAPSFTVNICDRKKLIRPGLTGLVQANKGVEGGPGSARVEAGTARVGAVVVVVGRADDEVVKAITIHVAGTVYSNQVVLRRVPVEGVEDGPRLA